MLTAKDIEWMRGNQTEVYGNRQTQIIIKYAGVVVVDEITGEETGGIPETREVLSVVTEISSATGAGADRILIGGVEVERGDVWLSISYDQISNIGADITDVVYDEKDYVVLAVDKKGIGGTLRVEVLGRVEA